MKRGSRAPEGTVCIGSYPLESDETAADSILHAITWTYSSLPHAFNSHISKEVYYMRMSPNKSALPIIICAVFAFLMLPVLTHGEQSARNGVTARKEA